MITKETKIDLISATDIGIVFYREATVYIEDGKEVSKSYHRTSLLPGQDLTNVPPQVAGICQQVWTDAVIDAWAQLQAQSTN